MSLLDTGSCGSSEPFALRVVGDDMMSEFEDGHIVIVDPGGIVHSGCYVVARVGEGVLLRQLVIEDSLYKLHALKEDVDDILLEHGLDDLVGVVSQRAGRRRSQHKHYG
jgi:DNA polymerase V